MVCPGNFHAGNPWPAGFSSSCNYAYGSPGAPAGTRVSESSWLFPSAEQITQADLSGLGVPGSRMETVKTLAAFFAEHGEECLDQTDIKDCLLALKGIGKWTAGYILMRTSVNHDHWPEGDLILRKALSKGKTMIPHAALEQSFSRWSPYRSYATIHIWKGYAPRVMSGKP